MHKYHLRAGALAVALLASTSRLLAQSDPWTSSATALQTAFTGPIATAMILVAIVLTGLTFAYSEGQGKKAIAGTVFGGSMAIGAARFFAWIFA